MLGGAYIQFGNQFVPHEDGYLYYRHSYTTQERLDGPVPVSAAEADAFARSFKRSVRLGVTATLLLFGIFVIGFAFVSEEGNAVVLGFLAAMFLLLVVCGVLTARAWSRPARVLADRPKHSPDPYPAGKP